MQDFSEAVMLSLQLVASLDADLLEIIGLLAIALAVNGLVMALKMTGMRHAYA
ncbi:MAG: hypothetical protein R3F54_24110 [Alphaproteobacteria bacterium]